jgi:hypothetical protein
VVGADSTEFADLIGAVGNFKPADGGSGSVTFMPDGRCDWLVMTVTKRTRKGKEIQLQTELGNTFTFQEVKTI